MRRVLVSGAQGFLGRYLVAHWLAEDPGVELVGFGRSPPRPEHFTHLVRWEQRQLPAPLPAALAAAARDPRYRYVPLDLLDRPALTALLREVRPDCVVHLAAVLRDGDLDALFATNVGGVAALLEGIARAGIAAPRVVLGSSGAVYGRPAPADLPLQERAPLGPAVDPYAVSKRAAEEVGRLRARELGIPVVWARIFHPVGPGQSEKHVCGWIASQVAAIGAGARAPSLDLGATHPTRDFIDGRDVAAALRVLAERGAAGEAYNVCRGEETSIAAVLATTLRLAGLEGAVHLVSRPGRRADVPRLAGDATRLRALGFTRSHPLTESLADLLAYYRGPVAERAAAPAEPAGASLSVTVRATYAYPVLVERGILATVPARIAALAPGARVVVLDDARVHALYGAPLVAALRALGIGADAVTVPDEEASKSLPCAADVIERLHAHGFGRRSLLVNLGGGLVTDLGGFVAGVYLRGVPYVNVPTTLLAQHDSALGGKVAVNTPWAKNFVGAFHHPRAVYCDPEVLVTLGPRDLGAGVAEAIKVGVLAEPALFALLEASAGRVGARDVGVLAEIVRRAAAAKLALLAPDPWEVDLARPLNLGHTFGHALEVELGYAHLRHGEAVAFGLAVATALAAARGVCPAGDAERILGVLDAYGLPPPVARRSLAGAGRRLGEIRLARGGRLNFVLPAGIGAFRIAPEVEDAEVAAAIEALAAHPRLGRAVAP